jgi:hypothetical protein
MCRFSGSRQQLQQQQLEVEVGGRECELREGWIRRLFSGASRPGSGVVCAVWELAARTGACPRALDDGMALALAVRTGNNGKVGKSADWLDCGYVDRSRGRAVITVLARQRVRERVRVGKGREVSRRRCFGSQQRRVCTRHTTAAAEDTLKSWQLCGAVPCRATAEPLSLSLAIQLSITYQRYYWSTAAATAGLQWEEVAGTGAEARHEGAVSARRRG